MSLAQPMDESGLGESGLGRVRARMSQGYTARVSQGLEEERVRLDSDIGQVRLG